MFRRSKLLCLVLTALTATFSGNAVWAQHHHGLSGGGASGGASHHGGGGGVTHHGSGGVLHHGGVTQHHSYSSPRYGGYGLGFGGLGYGGFGYGGLGYGFGYRSGVYNYYGPGLSNYRYYYSRPYSQPYYYYSQPSVVVPQQAYGMPSNAYMPIDPRYDGGQITLFSPAGSEGAVSYSLNGYSYTMQSGESQKFRNDRHWVIAIRRGAAADPDALYTLSTGRFKFKKTEQGWDVVEVEEPTSLTTSNDARPAPAVPTPSDSDPAEPKPGDSPSPILPKPATGRSQ